MGVWGNIDVYLDHAANKLNKSRGVVVGALLVEDHVAGHLRLVVKDIVIAVEDMLPFPHPKGDDATQGPDI